MPEFTDTLRARAEGGVPGFVGRDENIDPNAAPEEAPAAPAETQGEGNPHAYDPTADGQPTGF